MRSGGTPLIPAPSQQPVTSEVRDDAIREVAMPPLWHEADTSCSKAPAKLQHLASIVHSWSALALAMLLVGVTLVAVEYLARASHRHTFPRR